MVPYEALFIGRTMSRRPRRTIALDRREAVLEADRRADRGQAGDLEQGAGPPPANGRPGSDRSPRSAPERDRHGTYSPNGTRWTLSYRSTPPVPVQRSVEVDWVPSGSSITAPIRVGTPTSATVSRTSAIVDGSALRPGSRAPSPHTTRSGAGVVSVAVEPEVQLRDGDVLARRRSAPDSRRPPGWRLRRGPAVRVGEGIRRGAIGSTAASRDERPTRSHPSPAAGQQPSGPGDQQHEERQPPDAGHRGQADRATLVHLGHAELAPGEAPEGPQRPAATRSRSTAPRGRPRTTGRPRRHTRAPPRRRGRSTPRTARARPTRARRTAATSRGEPKLTSPNTRPMRAPRAGGPRAPATGAGWGRRRRAATSRAGGTQGQHHPAPPAISSWSGRPSAPGVQAQSRQSIFASCPSTGSDASPGSIACI